MMTCFSAGVRSRWPIAAAGAGLAAVPGALPAGAFAAHADSVTAVASVANTDRPADFTGRGSWSNFRMPVERASGRLRCHEPGGSQYSRGGYGTDSLVSSIPETVPQNACE